MTSKRRYSLIETSFLIRADSECRFNHLSDESQKAVDPERVSESNSSAYHTTPASSFPDANNSNAFEKWSISEKAEIDHFLVRSEEDEAIVQDELERGHALIVNISSFWSLDSALQEEFVRYPSWNLSEIPFVKKKRSLWESDSKQAVKKEDLKEFKNSLPKEDNVNGIELIQICTQLNNYLADILSVPSVLQSQALINFFSIPEENDMPIQNDEKEEKEGSIFRFSVRKRMDSNKSKLKPFSASFRTCFDYIFGNELYEAVLKLEQQSIYNHNDHEKFGQNGIIYIPRKKQFSKMMTIQSNECLLWRFIVISGPATSVELSVSLLEDEGTETEEEVSIDDDSTEETGLVQKNCSPKIVFEEKSCKSLLSNSTPHQGYFHYENKSMDNGKVTLTLKNSASLFRSAQVALSYQIVPYETYQAACMAANEQNEACKLRRYAPLLTHILSSLEFNRLKVEPLLLDPEVDNNFNGSKVDDNGKSLQNSKGSDMQLKAKSQAVSEINFDELLSTSWPDIHKSNYDQSVENTTKEEKQTIFASNHQHCTESSTKKAFSSHNLKTIVKPYQNQIKILKQEINQLARQFDKSQQRLFTKNHRLQEAIQLLQSLQVEKKTWKLAQQEIEITMKDLMIELNEMRERNMSATEFRKRIEKLEKENKDLSLSLTKERLASSTEIEELNKNIHTQKDDHMKAMAAAEMEADDAKMMKIVLEGKVRELQKQLNEKEGQLRDIIKAKNKCDDEACNDIESYDVPLKPLIIPDYITMPYTHPNPRLNLQLKKLQDRYVKLFHVIFKETSNSDDSSSHFGEKSEVQDNIETKKNERLLQKVGTAVQQIILSGENERKVEP